MQESVRRAVPGDVPTLERLHEAFVVEQVSHRGGRAWLGEQDGGVVPLPLPGPDDARVVFVGTLDDVALGYALADLTRSTTGSCTGRVRALYVEPPAREVGLGDALIGAVVEWCRAQGCDAVDAPAFPGARQMKNFFEAHGFVARLLVMRHPIADLDSGA